ncbi:agmatinase [Caldilinea sp.]|jgi:agmatinase|uniref:agmatinase n=2 Tax=Caldilinea sp. TaxID=2293560 RepID=UPI0021DEEA96|nr:agmatinase [Caldilinea sp.]GIV70062.1 MAG: agmatinase [Caldilinea sp.]
MTTPDNFLGLEAEYSDFARAGVLVLPIPFEATVSYGHGTGGGPQAILTASQQVELYDREYDEEPALHYGVHTLPALELPNEPEAAVAAIRAAAAEAARTGKFLVALGGEHTVSVGVGRGLLDALGGPLTIVQIDAHSDLRDRYEDTPYSHACIARRLLESPQVEQVLQLGIRSVCTEEVAFTRSHPDRVRVWYAEAVHEGRWREEFIERVRGRRVFLTIDVDGLDPSIVPATGTPEPDGLTWRETLEILRTLNEHADVIGMDCVELAPSPGLHMADFAVAKLIYKAISYTMMRTAWRNPPLA